MFAAFEELDPFAGFAEFNTQQDGTATAGASINARQESTAGPLKDGVPLHIYPCKQS